mmetsp:Transcript_36885/g.56457  ORF Transcript_36885/g.56457 Transcript_36885/m.56457 type:complete len:81 (-) Transcript_36885:1086-1328(-)
MLLDHNSMDNEMNINLIGPKKELSSKNGHSRAGGGVGISLQPSTTKLLPPQSNGSILSVQERMMKRKQREREQEYEMHLH